MTRYGHLGPVYDIVSLEAVLYRRPRRRLAELFGSQPGATIVDVGCGTGLNLPWLRDASSPGGHVIGIDNSPSMLDAARRRTRGWSDVTLLDGRAERLGDVLAAAHVEPDAVVATFALSLLADDTGFWTALADLASRRPVRVAMAELGDPRSAPRAVRPALAALTTLGGGDPSRRPWRQLDRLATDVVHETHLGGHVRLAVGTIGG